MNILKPLDRLGRFKKIVLWVAGILVTYTILGFLIIPFTIKLVAVKKLSEILNRPVAIESVRLNVRSVPEREQAEHPGAEAAGGFFAFNTLDVNLSSASIIKLAPVVEELKLDGLFVRVVRIKDTTFNFSDLITPKQPEANGPRLRLLPRLC